MKIIDVIKNQPEPFFSLEFTPPARGHGINEIFEPLDALEKYNPQFINVTYHQPQTVYKEIDGIISKTYYNKRPGTVGICASLKHRYQIEPVAHFICGGFNQFETEDALIDLQYLEIENIFAIRGDPPAGSNTFIPEPGGHKYSLELVKQISRMNQGEYIEPLDHAIPTHFCVGVAGYPEKHVEAPNLEKDLQFLKLKVDNGADYVITQMFFDFDIFKNFVLKARDMGINVPIIPGIKPLISKKQLDIIPRTFHTTIPKALVQVIDSGRTNESVFNSGINYTCGLIEKLIDFGVPGIHIFTMGKGKSAEAILKYFKK